MDDSNGCTSYSVTFSCSRNYTLTNIKFSRFITAEQAMIILCSPLWYYWLDRSTSPFQEKELWVHDDDDDDDDDSVDDDDDDGDKYWKNNCNKYK